MSNKEKVTTVNIAYRAEDGMFYITFTHRLYDGTLDVVTKLISKSILEDIAFQANTALMDYDVMHQGGSND